AAVVLDREGDEEQCRGGLGIGETVCGRSSDVRLLRGEHFARVVGAATCGLTRGEELVTRPLGKALAPDVAEHFIGGPELLTGIDAAVLATQPFAVDEPCAGEVDHATAAREPLHGRAV